MKLNKTLLLELSQSSKLHLSEGEPPCSPSIPSFAFSNDLILSNKKHPMREGVF